MPYEEAILVKIDKTTKRRMSSVEENWSELIRGFIQKELNKKKNVARAEKLRVKLFRTARGADSASAIRAMRESRYGPASA